MPANAALYAPLSVPNQKHAGLRISKFGGFRPLVWLPETPQGGLQRSEIQRATLGNPSNLFRIDLKQTRKTSLLFCALPSFIFRLNNKKEMDFCVEFLEPAFNRHLSLTLLQLHSPRLPINCKRKQFS